MKDKPLALGAHVKYHSADPDHSTRVGTIVEINQSHWEGSHNRPYKVLVENGSYPIYTWLDYGELWRVE